MPQYKLTQYGLKQYGLFLPTRPGGKTSRFEFVKSRMGVKLNGKLIYIYQHTPRVVIGQPKLMRLSSNTGESIYKRDLTIDGEAVRLRIRDNVSTNYTQSRNITEGGETNT